MSNLRSGGKLITELTIADFIAHPIWGFDDDDSDEVIPINYPGFISWPASNAVFVRCEFELNDGTRLEGVVSVRLSDQVVYLAQFPKADGHFVSLRLQPSMRTSTNFEQLANVLQKTLSQIFPIRYRTPYRFRDGDGLIGELSYYLAGT